ncbi:MAG TPA: histidine--tRNA ligase [Oligoflexia bacterium]|nr:histidine--tRNA ligase [Oligoflexia bacterium]
MGKPAIEPRILKGFRDYLPQTTIARSEMIDRIKTVFQSFGFVPIDTPALEYADILLGKGSAETDKQLYRFLDNGQRDVALRFDLTVPLARFAAMHIGELGTPFKRYHIAPVWRAEKPQRGRFREFIQCDFDIIGTKSVLADAEIILVIHQTFRELGVNHRIRLNNRRVLNGFLESLGALDKSCAVLRAIDKLEKLGQDVVSTELKSEAHFSPEQTARVFDFLNLSQSASGGVPFFTELRKLLESSRLGLEGITQLERILSILAESGVEPGSCIIDLSIARGLDYYTGSVFETTLIDLPEIGSVCSGGRYDNLASLYTSQELPGVGASVGLDRLLAGLEELGRIPARSSTAEILVAIADPETAPQAIALAQRLRGHGLHVETYAQEAKLGAQLKYADRKNIRCIVIAGKEDLACGRYSIKDMRTGEQVDSVAFDSLVEMLRQHLADRNERD